MAITVIALAASTLAGVAVGFLCASRAGAAGRRPRRPIREHRAAVARASAVLGITAAVVAGGAVVTADHLRAALAVTCSATAVLVAIATWLVLVEPEDGGEVDAWVDPKWWPQFERDLNDWVRRRRVPAGTRS